jgi:hypothetical protein
MWGSASSHRAPPTAKEIDQDNCESRQKLAAAQGWLTHFVVRAPHKGHGHEGPGKNSVVQGTQKGQMFGKRCWAKPGCSNSIRN